MQKSYQKQRFYAAMKMCIQIKKFVSCSKPICVNKAPPLQHLKKALLLFKKYRMEIVLIEPEVKIVFR